MKKLFIPLIVSFCTILFALPANAQTNWVLKKIDNRISVKFPAEPSPIAEGVTGYKFLYTDSSLITASLVDLEQMGLDSATLAGLIETEEFFEQFKVGLTGQTPDAEITKSVIVKWNNYVAYEIEGVDKSKNQKIFFKCIFIGAKMYVFSCIFNSTTDILQKETYFKSIELTK